MDNISFSKIKNKDILCIYSLKSPLFLEESASETSITLFQEVRL